MSNVKDEYLTRDLPKVIYAQHRAQYLNWGEIDDNWFVSYGAATPFPDKKVIIHYEESTLERAVLKTFRYLALHKTEWELFSEEVK